MKRSITPLFIFSQPRAGSTLAQRILGSHKEIATAGEPWILLPYLYTLKSEGCYTEYGHNQSSQAVEDFCKGLEHGKDDYFAAMRNFVLNLYAQRARKDVKYFLDKTPRYHLVVNDIIELFPNGKFIFLWRNPLAVVASIMETWAQGKWNIYLNKVDIFGGIENLVSAYQKNMNIVHHVRYEDMLTNAEKTWTGICEYLELSFDHSLLNDFKDVQFSSRLSGDPVGTKMYKNISKEPLNKWKAILANPIRKAWCKKYLKWIGRERLAVMGYNIDQLTAELDDIPTSLYRIVSDLVRIPYGVVFCGLELYMMGQKFRCLTEGKRVYIHR